MMKTPICDFVREYSKKDPLRLHMPAHKGCDLLGFEKLDITEINGADSLYEADGIIAESEKNASKLFGAKTFYSAEGSSLSIRAMLYLARIWSGKSKIFAARNAHRAFITSAALLELDIEWIYPKGDCYLSGSIDLAELEEKLCSEEKSIVYITSPDYLGQVSDIEGISAICKRHNALLCVDNAHGAYLKFLPRSRHPIDLGADICCDSAHKTLPVITGGGYLHISERYPELAEKAKNAMALFGSTSPSYLILQSLDMANRYISEGYCERLSDFTETVKAAKERLSVYGYALTGNEELKIVISAKDHGYYGFELAERLEESGIICEFSDRDNTVMMVSPENGKNGIEKLIGALCTIPRREKINEKPPIPSKAVRAISPREAVFSESEIIKAEASLGRIIFDSSVSCPPAVPIIMCGEVIDSTALECFKYYGIEYVRVVRE